MSEVKTDMVTFESGSLVRVKPGNDVIVYKDVSSPEEFGPQTTLKADEAVPVVFLRMTGPSILQTDELKCAQILHDGSVWNMFLKADSTIEKYFDKVG
jgi:hypothetical protein